MIDNLPQNYELGIVTSNQTQLTLKDIQNNLKKRYKNNLHNLNNVYDFLNTLASSNGRFGFIEISRKSRKNSLESIHSIRGTSPNPIREKSLILNARKSSSPHILSPGPLNRVKSNEDLKFCKTQKQKAIRFRKPLKVLSKEKPETEIIRSRLSPYGSIFQRPERLPKLCLNKKNPLKTEKKSKNGAKVVR